jgi:hypothetical protein
MATFLFHDSNKAAFINGLNKLLKDNSIDYKISKRDVIDTPSAAKAQFTLYVSDEPQVVDILKQAVKSKHFDFTFKEIDLKEVITKSKNLESK